jgi:transposase
MLSSDFLSVEDRTYFSSVYRKRVVDSVLHKRAHILLLLDKGWIVESVASVFFTSNAEIMKVYVLYLADKDKLTGGKSTGRRHKLAVEQEQSLIAHLDTAHYSSSYEIIDHIKTVYGVDYSHSGILSLLHNLDFKHEETRVVNPVPSEEVQQKAIDAYQTLKKNLPQNEVILHLDGVHPTHMAKTGKIWMKSDKKLGILANTGRQRMNIQGAIDVQTGQFTFMENLTINTEMTIQFLEKISNVYKGKEKIHIFLDNARYQKNYKIDEWIIANGNRIKLHFLPVYCPHLNPIERLWHIMIKNATRNRYYKTFNEFADSILTFFKKTLPQNWENIKKYVNDNFRILSANTVELI